MPGDGRTAESAWTPLSHPVFRALWIASLVSNIGTWMQNVGTDWMMATLATASVALFSSPESVGAAIYAGCRNLAPQTCDASRC